MPHPCKSDVPPLLARGGWDSRSDARDDWDSSSPQRTTVTLRESSSPIDVASKKSKEQQKTSTYPMARSPSKDGAWRFPRKVSKGSSGKQDVEAWMPYDNDQLKSTIETTCRKLLDEVLAAECNVFAQQLRDAEARWAAKLKADRQELSLILRSKGFDDIPQSSWPVESEVRPFAMAESYCCSPSQDASLISNNLLLEPTWNLQDSIGAGDATRFVEMREMQSWSRVVEAIEEKVMDFTNTINRETAALGRRLLVLERRQIRPVLSSTMNGVQVGGTSDAVSREQGVPGWCREQAREQGVLESSPSIRKQTRLVDADDSTAAMPHGFLDREGSNDSDQNQPSIQELRVELIKNALGTVDASRRRRGGEVAMR